MTNRTIGGAVATAVCDRRPADRAFSSLFRAICSASLADLRKADGCCIQGAFRPMQLESQIDALQRPVVV